MIWLRQQLFATMTGPESLIFIGSGRSLAPMTREPVNLDLEINLIKFRAALDLVSRDDGRNKNRSGSPGLSQKFP